MCKILWKENLMEELSKIWDEVDAMFKLELDEIPYNTWIYRLKPLDFDDNNILILAPNEFTKTMVEQRFTGDIKKYLNYLLNTDVNVIITDPSEDIESLDGKSLEKSYTNNIEKNDPNEDKDIETIASEEYRRDKDNKIDIKAYQYPNRVISKYNFQNFVRGKSNEFALSATKAVANNPGNLYNPLFIYGGVGLGKTHLMNACAQSILENFPDKKVVYLSSETFTNELIQSLNTGKNIEFRNKYRLVDVLLIDDIQFIAGKAGTQEEFFHTFNALYEDNKQIVISADSPPKEIKALEERLVSRFEWGLIADIGKPDFETRVAILNKKIEQEGVYVPDDVLEFMAMNIKDNIRELEGALLKVIAYASLKDTRNINIDLASEALKELIVEKESKIIDIDFIKEVVADFYSVRIEDLSSKNRSQKVVFPRHVAMCLCRKLTDLSLIKIADSFNKDHSTVIHAVEKIENLMEEDESVRDEISSIVEIIED